MASTKVFNDLSKTLASNFSRGSDGRLYKFVTISQMGEARQRSKKIRVLKKSERRERLWNTYFCGCSISTVNTFQGKNGYTYSAEMNSERWFVITQSSSLQLSVRLLHRPWL